MYICYLYLITTEIFEINEFFKNFFMQYKCVIKEILKDVNAQFDDPKK